MAHRHQPRDALKAVEARLKQIVVRGIIAPTFKRTGKYANFFSHGGCPM